MEVVLKVLEQYGIVPLKVKPLDGGIINHTFLVYAKEAMFILQVLNDIYTQQVILDQVHISEFLEQCGFPYQVPKLIKTIADDNFVIDRDGQIWRMYKFIENNQVEIGRHKAGCVCSMAKALALLHGCLSKCDYQPLHRISGFGDTNYYIGKMENILFSTQETDEFRYLADQLLMALIANPMPSGPKILIHGDPKQNNFLFNEDDQVIGLIDFDSFMRANVFRDIGDAFRSWCKTKDNKFDFDLFEMAGWIYWVHFAINDQLKIERFDEVALQAVKLITLELSLRFLIDAHEQTYFAWDKDKYSSAREHNLARCRQYLAYFDSMTR